MKIRITIRAKNGNLYTRKVIITEWLNNEGEWSRTANDGHRIYHPVDDHIVHGQNETIWGVK